MVRVKIKYGVVFEKYVSFDFGWDYENGWKKNMGEKKVRRWNIVSGKRIIIYSFFFCLYWSNLKWSRSEDSKMRRF